MQRGILPRHGSHRFEGASDHGKVCRALYGGRCGKSAEYIVCSVSVEEMNCVKNTRRNAYEKNNICFIDTDHGF